MKAWPPDNDRGPSTSVPAVQAKADTPSLSSELYREMTRVFVNMILGTKEVKT
jgi:hypothetical protein